MKYVFVLGRDPELSVLELVSYFKSKEIKYNIIESDKYVALIELDEIDSKKIISDLGGTVKIAKVVSENLGNFDYNYLGSKDKISYGVSSYGKTDDEPLKKKIKSIFKEQKLKAMRKKGKTKELTPSDLVNLDLEFVLYKKYIAETVAFFDPSKYKERDQRPANDFLKSTSIRLAKIMINLAQPLKNETLLDPFCGTGIILQEALLKNLDVMGVDIDKWSVDASRKNLDWIKHKYNLKNNFNVIRGDSAKINQILKKKVDIVVTEPYLGPFLKDLPSFGEAKKVAKELEMLYSDYFNRVSDFVKKRMVIIVPSFITKERKTVKFDFEKIARENGFKIEMDPIESPICYSERKTRINRYIYVLNKK
ncbi:MAG: methyltransferase domain-containing protein [Nanoarchaeota archaeon]|nr:methyltransferase domain-containing protein [Nanoarchaeota archaeon]MBU3941055.1 methyltransferase domain-containing protein [Nanoarchaeota archaeon]